MSNGLNIESLRLDDVIQRMLDAMGYHDASQISVEDFRKMMHDLAAFEHNWNLNIIQMFSDHLKFCTSVPPIDVSSLVFPTKIEKPRIAPGLPALASVRLGLG